LVAKLTLPLCKRALAILSTLPRKGDLIFAGSRTGDAASPHVLLRLLRRLGYATETVHGFRSSFRDWAAEKTNFPREVAEKALAHAVGDVTERSYARTDFFDLRRRLMDSWSEFCSKPAAKPTATVTPIRA
jgi:integrase